MKNVWKYALIASLGGFLFGFETAVISGAEQIIQKLWNLDSFWHGLTVSISLIGTILGAISAGKFMNKYGRKRVLIAVSIFFLLSAVGCALVVFWSMFLFFRVFGGVLVVLISVFDFASLFH